MSDTIAAISTPLSEGGIGIVRISGEDAKKIAAEVFKSSKGKDITSASGYSAFYGKVYEGSNFIDEGIALIFTAPHSYTGEDVAEISCHGGIYVMKRVLRAVLAAGAKLAEAGEFTKRAFLNGKLTLTQAEAVMDVISAGGEQALGAANTAKEGALFKKINAVKEKLILASAQVAAFIDFPEEGLPDMDLSDFEQILIGSKTELKNLLENFDTGKIVREGIDCAIVGRPNVGKSTVMNLLTGSESSIVTSVAGTTRDIIEESVKVGDITLRLSDMAGIRNTSDIVESIGVDKAKTKLKNAFLVLAVFDSSEKLTAEDKEILELIKNKRTIIIINKTDLEPKLDINELSGFKDIIFISALKEVGIDELTKKIKEVTGTAEFDPNAAMLAGERQKDCAKRAYLALENVYDDYKSGQTFDAVGVMLDEAVGALMELTGESVSESVVNEVFSRFCVGK